MEEKEKPRDVGTMKRSTTGERLEGKEQQSDVNNQLCHLRPWWRPGLCCHKKVCRSCGLAAAGLCFYQRQMPWNILMSEGCEELPLPLIRPS